MISVIIPVLNEEKIIADMLNQVLQQNGSYEVIVVDGNSSDRTVEIVSSFADVRLVRSETGRARQMNAGAQVAKGDWLCFLHADTALPANAILKLEGLNLSNYDAGCFHQRFSGNHILLRAISWLHNWRCSRTHIMYGDQTIFIRKQLFMRVGAFPEVDLLEDVVFSENLLKYSTPVMLADEVLTDSRKFEQRGIVRSFFEIAIILICYELRLPIMGRGFFSPVR